MYFSPERARKVVQGLYNSLLNDGWLLVSPTEAFKFISSQFVTVNFSSTTLYRKDSKKPHVVEDARLMEIPSYIPFEESKMGTYQPSAFIPEPLTPAVSPESPPTLKIKKRTQEEPQPDTYRKAAVLFKYGFYAEAMEKVIGSSLDGQGKSKNLALLARTCANQGKLDNAQKWCEKAIANDKLNRGYYHLLATILLECGQIEKAVIALKKALYLDNNFVLDV